MIVCIILLKVAKGIWGFSPDRVLALQMRVHIPFCACESDVPPGWHNWRNRLLVCIVTQWLCVWKECVLHIEALCDSVKPQRGQGV